MRADSRHQKSNACYSAWEPIARTCFSVNDVPKLQGNQTPCQRAVLGMTFEDSEHADSRHEKLNASLSAWEAIARTCFPVNDVPKLQGNQTPCQRAVRGMNFEDSEHAVSRRKISNACYSAWEAIDLTVIFR